MKFHNKNAKHKKPYKKPRLWIEHCKSPPQHKQGNSNHDMSIVITRVHLTDSCLPIMTTPNNSATTDDPLPHATSNEETKEGKVLVNSTKTHDTGEAVPTTTCQDDATPVVPTEGTPNEESASSSNNHQSTTDVPDSTTCDPKEPKQPFITVMRSESSNVKIPHVSITYCCLCIGSFRISFDSHCLILLHSLFTNDTNERRVLTWFLFLIRIRIGKMIINRCPRVTVGMVL
jgi:hypothetical protein